MHATLARLLHDAPQLPLLPRRWLSAAAAVLALALVAGAAGGWWATHRGKPLAPVAKEAPLTVAQRRAQADCVEGALLLTDVRWAAVCMKLAAQGQGDGHADCELPDAESNKLYALLQREEKRCLAFARETP